MASTSRLLLLLPTFSAFLWDEVKDKFNDAQTKASDTLNDAKDKVGDTLNEAKDKLSDKLVYIMDNGVFGDARVKCWHNFDLVGQSVVARRARDDCLMCLRAFSLLNREAEIALFWDDTVEAILNPLHLPLGYAARVAKCGFGVGWTRVFRGLVSVSCCHEDFCFGPKPSGAAKTLPAAAALTLAFLLVC